MKIIEGKIERAQKVVLYGPEGIGKSTFAAQFPDSLFIDTEESTLHMDVKRLDRPTSWQMLLSQVKWVVQQKPCKTLVIDTADWAEKLAIEKIVGQFQLDGLEGLGWGKGYTYLEEEFGRLLNLLSDVIQAGIHVCMTAHATIKKFEQPDEMGAYDRWELKLQRKTSPLVKEWADMLLFANYKTTVVNIASNTKEPGKGKYKAQGGRRVMYSQHTPAWDAKNRHGLPGEMELSFNEISHVISQDLTTKNSNQPEEKPEEPIQEPAFFEDLDKPLPFDMGAEGETESFVKHKKLHDLLVANKIEPSQIQAVVGAKGYFPADMSINDYPTDFIDQVLVAAWDQVVKEIKE